MDNPSTSTSSWTATCRNAIVVRAYVDSSDSCPFIVKKIDLGRLRDEMIIMELNARLGNVEPCRCSSCMPCTGG